MVKNLPANAGDMGSTPGSGRSPGGGNGYPRQYSCWENPMDREAWWVTVHGVVKYLATKYQQQLREDNFTKRPIFSESHRLWTRIRTKLRKEKL